MSYELLKGFQMFAFFQNLVLAGAATTLFYFYRERRESIFLLALFFLLTALRSLVFYVNNYSAAWVIGAYANELLLVPVFVQPVLIYLFVRSITQEGQRLTPRDLFHFLPAILVFLAVQLKFLVGVSGAGIIDNILSEKVLTSVEIVLLLGYATTSGALVYGSKKKLTQYRLLMSLVACTFVAGLAVLGAYLSMNLIDQLSFNPFIFVHLLNGLLIFLFTLAILAGYFNWTTTFQLRQKYSHSGLNEREAGHIRQGILRLMDERQLYLEPELELDDLARELGNSRFQVSQVLSEQFTRSFYELVNEYRVREVQRKLSSPDHRKQNISEIAYSSGFNSLATFNRSFKAISGMTPSAYRKAHLPIG